MEPVQPILVAHLFPRVEAELLSLLKGLSLQDWNRPTVCRLWTVKDIAAHLLDTSLRRLSAERDAHIPGDGDSPANYAELVDMLNRLNAEWVQAARRISPQLLVDLIELASRQLCEHLNTLDPFGTAIFPVAWAGEDSSAAWFDIAREYTERWHHQQQIRDAVGRQGICTQEFLHPTLDTFLRGLPHACRDLRRPEGCLLLVRITGEAGGEWGLLQEGGGWKLVVEVSETPDALVEIDQDAAWRLFTKGLSPDGARKKTRLQGDQELAEGLLGLLAVMA